MILCRPLQEPDVELLLELQALIAFVLVDRLEGDVLQPLRVDGDLEWQDGDGLMGCRQRLEVGIQVLLCACVREPCERERCAREHRDCGQSLHEASDGGWDGGH